MKPSRSVDLAAAALIVREAGGYVLTPDVASLPLDLDARDRLHALRIDEHLHYPVGHVDGRAPVDGFLENDVEFFGNWRLRDIRTDDLVAFRLKIADFLFQYVHPKTLRGVAP